MKKVIGIAVLSVSICLFATAGFSGQSTKGKSGEELFKEHCTSCHPNGGNNINPQKTLQKSSREANNIKSEKDIIDTMRNPGPGMTKFDKKTISDSNAKKIAKYILDTFK